MYIQMTKNQFNPEASYIKHISKLVKVMLLIIFYTCPIPCTPVYGVSLILSYIVENI